jgi:hypothetical protein
MNVYELFGLVLVAGMVVMLLLAAHALGEGARTARRAEQQAAERAEEHENSEV